MLRRLRYFFLTSPPALTLAGYFANWKMFDPRKLIPFSIEYCNAPIAVMTEMTEKTPMVIPNMVRPERSLFTPNDPRAMVMISENRMSILLKENHREHGDHGATMKLLRVRQLPSDECHASGCAH